VSLTSRDRSRQRRLPVIHVTDRAHVHMGLVPIELFLGHLYLLDYLFSALTSGWVNRTSGKITVGCQSVELSNA
jgi:hypothetical protein